MDLPHKFLLLDPVPRKIDNPQGEHFQPGNIRGDHVVVEFQLLERRRFPLGKGGYVADQVVGDVDKLKSLVMVDEEGYRDEIVVHTDLGEGGKLGGRDEAEVLEKVVAKVEVL